MYERDLQSNLIFIQTRRGSSSGPGRVCINATFNQTVFSYKLNVGQVRVRAQVKFVSTRLSINPFFHTNSTWVEFGPRSSLYENKVWLKVTYQSQTQLKIYFVHPSRFPYLMILLFILPARFFDPFDSTKPHHNTNLSRPNSTQNLLYFACSLRFSYLISLPRISFIYLSAHPIRSFNSAKIYFHINLLGPNSSHIKPVVKLNPR